MRGMRSNRNWALPLGLLFVSVQAISSATVDRMNTTTSNVTTTPATLTAAPAVSSVVVQADTNVTAPPPSANITQIVPMVMEGNSNLPSKSELRKDSETRKKTEPENQPKEKPDDLSDSFPSKEQTKPSVVKPRKGVGVIANETSVNSPNIPCSNSSSIEQAENCPPPVVEETKSSSETPSVVSPHPKHHHKPNVTADGPEEPAPVQREDYVIPVVGIIFVIPLIGILGALVYKKGVDLWERRHYRPMDFLIDGIYNNQ